MNTMSENEVVQLGELLLAKYGLTDWKVNLINTKVTAGLCSHHNKTISISKHFISINDKYYIYNTLVHEVAHARLPASEGHSKLWKDTFLAMGGNGERFFVGNLPEKKHVLRCPTCGREYKYHRKPRKRRVCGDCGRNEIRPEYILETIK